MPFPGTQVFHEDWEAHHRPIAEDAQTGTGYFLRYSSEKVFNEATGKSEYLPPTPVYGTALAPVPMRVVRDGVDTAVIIGERQIVKRSYVVAVAASAPQLLINDEFRAVAAGDTELPGEPMWVKDVRFGSQIWERDLVCDNVPPANR